MSDAGDTKKSAKAPKMAECTACGALYAKAKQIEFICKKVDLAQETARMCPACRRKAFVEETEQKLTRDGAGARR